MSPLQLHHHSYHHLTAQPNPANFHNFPQSKSLIPAHVPQSHQQQQKHLLKQIPLAASTMTQKRDHLSSTLPDTVFLLDWDDTCCPTTYLEWYGIMADLDIRLNECAPHIHMALRQLEQRVLNLLKSSIQLGQVLIITNAGDGWVELSSERFLPAVKTFLDQHYQSIKIISARSRYIDTYKNYPWRWKALTFSDELQTILMAKSYQPYQLNVVVLGDSPGDRYAAYDSSNTLAKMGMPITLKIVKFLERPTIDQLCKELAVLLDHLSVMTRHNGSFEVSMSNEQQQQQQPSEPEQQLPQQQQQQQQSQHSAPEGVNPHDLSYHPYSPSSASSTCSTDSTDSLSSTETTSSSMSTSSTVEDTDVPTTTSSGCNSNPSSVLADAATAALVQSSVSSPLSATVAPCAAAAV